jgi:deoxycytidylate deaminase
MPSISSSISRSSHHQSEDEADVAPAKPESPTRRINNRPNLSSESLESVKELKNSIKLMRVHRRKVKFSESISDSAGGDTVGDNNNNPNIMGNTSGNSSFTTLGSSSSKASSGSRKQQHQQQQDSNDATFSRLSVGLTMQDLERMGSLKRSPDVQLPPLADQVASLLKQVKKAKRMVKRTCRDVWAERDEIVNLQRQNWSIRKTLVQTDAPQDSVTSLNLNIAKLVRQERELDLSMDQMEDEKQLLESGSVALRQSIDNFNDLLHQLNAQILPLLPTFYDDDISQPSREGGGAGFGIRAPISMVVTSSTMEDCLSDSLHSTEEVEDLQQNKPEDNDNALAN